MSRCSSIESALAPRCTGCSGKRYLTSSSGASRAFHSLTSTCYRAGAVVILKQFSSEAYEQLEFTESCRHCRGTGIESPQFRDPDMEVVWIG